MGWAPIIAVGAVVLGLTPAAASAAMTGGVAASPAATVVIKTRGRHVTISVASVRLECYGPSTLQVDLPTLRLRLNSKRQFEGQRYWVDADGTRTFFELSGTRERGFAHGRLIVYRDADDSAGIDGRQCQTVGKDGWWARREGS